MRHGASGGVRGGRLRCRALHRLRVGAWHRAGRDPETPGRRHPAVLRERSALSGTVSVLITKTTTKHEDTNTSMVWWVLPKLPSRLRVFVVAVVTPCAC